MNDGIPPVAGSARRGTLLVLTVVTMTAFAANSILCRMARKDTAIEPATFTAIRYVSLSAGTGALILFGAVQAPSWIGATLMVTAGVAWDAHGALLALLSGATASGLGYAIWYTVLPALRATQAATVQLSVPVIAALAGVLLLGEHLSLRLVFCSIAILGGIALVLHARKPSQAMQR